MPKVRKLYLCNHERCKEKCSYPTCNHTSQRYFAKYKIEDKQRQWLVHTYSDGEKLYFEKEREIEKEKENDI